MAPPCKSSISERERLFDGRRLNRQMNSGQSFSHLRLLAVVGPPVVIPELVVESCLAAEAGGITALQIRWKDAAASELVALTEKLVQALSIPVYVNDRADVAWVTNAAGVHLGADDLDPVRVRAESPSGFLIGASVGTSTGRREFYISGPPALFPRERPSCPYCRRW